MRTRNRKCFFPNCKTGYKTCKVKFSLFSTPTDPELLKKWNEIIPRLDRDISTRDVVCAKHFNPQDIITEWKSGDISIKYLKPRLLKTAIPSILPRNRLNKSKQLVKKTPKATLLEKKTSIINSPQESLLEKKVSIPNSPTESLPEKCNEELITIKNKNCSIDSSAQHSELPDKDYPSISEFVDHDKNVFELIWSSQIKLKLPSQSWAVHLIEKDKLISISETGVSAQGIPMHYRHILFNEKLNLKIFVGNKQVTNSTIINDFLLENQTQADLENMLMKLKSYKICPGGPTLNIYPENKISTNLAYVDHNNNKWKHKLCLIIYSTLDVHCTNCAKLFQAFSYQLKTINRNSPLTETRKLYYNSQKLLLRYRRKTEHLRECLERTKNQLQNKRYS